MEIGPFDVTTRPDRFATSDEIRSALSFLPEMFGTEHMDSGWEVASDLGGYVRIELGGHDSLTLLEKLDGSNN